MSEDFSVHHNGFSDANDYLLAHVRALRGHLNDLEAVLRNSEAATQGKALPLWQDAQTKWRANASDMELRLSVAHNNSVGAHDIFMDGDNKAMQQFL